MVVLRTTGRPEEASRVEQTEFAAAVTALEERGYSPENVQDVIQEIQETEAKRVEDAVAFAELLAPLLAKHWQREEREGPAQRPAMPPPAPPPPATRRPRGIADFIDEMIAQERHP